MTSEGSPSHLTDAATGPFVCLCGFQTDRGDLFEVHVAGVHLSSRYEAWRIPAEEFRDATWQPPSTEPDCPVCRELRRLAGLGERYQDWRFARSQRSKLEKHRQEAHS